MATAAAGVAELPAGTSDARTSSAAEYEAAEGSDCFLFRLQCIQVEESEYADAQKASSPDAVSSHPAQYVDKRPRWWRRQAGRRGTRSQRAALSRMSQLGYVIERTNYGVELDVVALFGERNRRSSEENGNEHTEGINSGQNKTTTTAKCANDTKEYWLEIGFGRGENLLASARMHPERCYIGADVHQPGACITLSRMEEAVSTGEYWDGPTLHGKMAAASDIVPRPFQNVRIYCGDGIKLLHSIPSQSLTAIVLPFPDPWPENHGQCKWRIIQPDTLRCLERVLKLNGVFYLATDDEAFDEWCRDIFFKHGRDRGWKEVRPCPDRSGWLPAISTYEEKGVKGGRCINLRCWIHSELS